MDFTPSIDRRHTQHCFDTLVAHLNGKLAPEYPKNLPDFSAPLFVTWTTNPGKELRGCIGTFESQNLSKNLSKYALISAVQDSRFSPINKSELPRLNCSVSILLNFVDRESWDKWEVGVHGIEIEYKHNGGKYRGTFLPEVAKEQGWDQEETLKYLIRKSGCSDHYKSILHKVKLTTYESVKVTLSYEEYQQMAD